MTSPPPDTAAIADLARAARACTLCAPHLPLGPRPILQAPPAPRVLIVSQAPGTRAHASGIPWHDASGDRLRDWFGVDRTRFYDSGAFAILPMGFCYPGRGRGGDLPPRPECAPRWHPAFLRHYAEVPLVLLIGQYAQARYLGARRKPTLALTVQSAAEYGPRYLPLPHPSPRNGIWLRRNPWFETDVLPELRRRVAQACAAP